MLVHSNSETGDFSNTALLSSVASCTLLLDREDEDTMGKKTPLFYTKIIILRNFSNCVSVSEIIPIFSCTSKSSGFDQMYFELHFGDTLW